MNVYENGRCMKLPLSHYETSERFYIGDGGRTVAQIINVDSWSAQKARADYFVKAANCFEELLAACKELLNYTGGWDERDPTHPIVIARKAIAKAEAP